MLKFTANNQIITRTDDFRVVADSRDYLTAEFELSEEWTGDTVAVFCREDKVFHQLLEGNSCIVPSQAIKAPGFTVSLFCEGDRLVTANVIWVAVESSGLCEGTEPQEPQPELWQQYVSRMQSLIESGLPYIGDNYHWFIYDPDTGDYEDTGITAKGEPPVKGTDYWTEEDKTEIVEEVLASLPDADTMSFPLEKTVSEVNENE